MYWLLYYLFYRFSGAHQKPTSDDKFDPKMAHSNHSLCRLLRWWEEKEYDKLCHEQLGTLTLPTLDLNSANQESFQLLSRNKQHPVVIRGLIKDCTAVKQWNPDFFTSHYGDVKLLTLRKPANQSGNAYTNFNEPLDFKDLCLKDSIKAMQEGHETLYINNITQIFADHPQLVNDLELNRIDAVDTSIDAKTWLKINLFMGGPGTGSSLHCAVGGNFFFNVYGKKRWVLIHPQYTRFLKSTPSKDFEFVISGLDIENPSDVLKKIPKYEVVLEPGDVLYVAPWFWHYVKNETPFTIGCAVRDHTVYKQSFKNNPMFMTMSPYPFYINPWLLKLVEKFKGRNFLIQKSAQSEKDIIGNLTSYQK